MTSLTNFALHEGLLDKKAEIGKLVRRFCDKVPGLNSDRCWFSADGLIKLEVCSIPLLRFDLLDSDN